ncbi:MAG: hypothetical protein C5B50_22685 [Verrucomicrobia bacterium]|nr:MAG: hypothetical protein C5B50_22685 [Verrucomicrobiota bacterium]
MSALARLRISFYFSFGLVLCGCRHGESARLSGAGGTPALLYAGAAEVDITPPIGFRMAGYFDERLATAVHDPLHAKALVLKQGGQEIALVVCDLVGVPLLVTTNARAQASQATGIPISHIVIAGTHSHTGPLFSDVRSGTLHDAAVRKYGEDPHQTIDYPQFLIPHLVKVIVAAHSKLQPAELFAGVTKQEGLTFNRRYWMKNGKVAFNPGQLNPNIVRPAGPTDTDVGVILLTRPGTKQPFAGLTTFAVHSDTVGGTEFSADYEYYLEQTLKRRFGKDFVSVFGLGTCGDLNHIDVTKADMLKGFPMAEHIGTTLGAAVIQESEQLLKEARSRASGTFAVASTTIQVELQDISPDQLADARAMSDKLADPGTEFMRKVVAVKVLDLAVRGSTWPMEVQVFRLNSETALVCLPAEIFVELGLAIKHASPFKNTIVLSICNDRPSYVPTEKAFKEGSYEVTNSRVKPGTGEKLVQTALELLNQVKPHG